MKIQKYGKRSTSKDEIALKVQETLYKSWKHQLFMFLCRGLRYSTQCKIYSNMIAGFKPEIQKYGKISTEMEQSLQYKYYKSMKNHFTLEKIKISSLNQARQNNCK